MIPRIPIATNKEAKYTKLFKDISDESVHLITTLMNTFGTSGELYNHVVARFRYYEICDEDEDIFVQCISDTFTEYKEYYTQRLTAYNNDISFTDILKRISSRTDGSTSHEEGSASGTGSGTNKEYNLPNKLIDPQNENGYLSNKDTTDTSTSGSDERDRESEYTSETETKDNRDFISLKEQYLKHIRDIYEEFAEKFKDCFLHIY